MSSEVAVERTGIQITKSISSLRNTTRVATSIYTKQAMCMDQCRLVHRPCLHMFGYQRIITGVISKVLIRLIVNDKEAA